jgi:hypothetical protein
MGCGFAMGPLVAIKERDGRCFPSGVKSCGSVWVCPVCSAKIRARREIELEAACREWVDRGGQLAMLTFTLRHDQSMHLDEVLHALTLSYRKLRNRKAFRVLREFLGGAVKALELTYGQNGWHPHLHVLLFVKPEVERELVEAIKEGLITDWRELAADSLGSVPSVARAIDLLWFGSDAETAAGYVSKIAKEISLADTKSGYDPFALLDVEGVERDRAVALFIEYANVMRGRHSIDWSPGLRDLLGIGADKTDEEIAAEDDEVGEIVDCVELKEWNRLVVAGRVQEHLEWCEQRWRSERDETVSARRVDSS